MKNQRLAYELLADSLKDRELVDGESLNHILHQCASTGALFPELLVREGLVSDWELSRVACDVFGLPFLPLDVYQPSTDLKNLLEPAFQRHYCIVPLDRFGGVMTVAMPAMVEAEVLKQIEDQHEVKVKPIVSSVQSNLRWIEEHVAPPELPVTDAEVEQAGEWTDVLDAGEDAVKSEIEAPQTLQVDEAELESTLQMFDLGEDEDITAGIPALEPDDESLHLKLKDDLSDIGGEAA